MKICFCIANRSCEAIAKFRVNEDKDKCVCLKYWRSGLSITILNQIKCFMFSHLRTKTLFSNGNRPTAILNVFGLYQSFGLFQWFFNVFSLFMRCKSILTITSYLCLLNNQSNFENRKKDTGTMPTISAQNWLLKHTNAEYRGLYIILWKCIYVAFLVQQKKQILPVNLKILV